MAERDACELKRTIEYLQREYHVQIRKEFPVGSVVRYALRDTRVNGRVVAVSGNRIHVRQVHGPLYWIYFDETVKRVE